MEGRKGPSTCQFPTSTNPPRQPLLRHHAVDAASTAPSPRFDIPSMAAEPLVSIAGHPGPVAHPTWIAPSAGFPKPQMANGTPPGGQTGYPNTNIDFDMLSLIMQLQRVCPQQSRDDLQRVLSSFARDRIVKISKMLTKKQKRWLSSDTVRPFL
jgi:hypothetical protein